MPNFNFLTIPMLRHLRHKHSQLPFEDEWRFSMFYFPFSTERRLSFRYYALTLLASVQEIRGKCTGNAITGIFSEKRPSSADGCENWPTLHLGTRFSMAFIGSIPTTTGGGKSISKSTAFVIGSSFFLKKIRGVPLKCSEVFLVLCKMHVIFLKLHIIKDR